MTGDGIGGTGGKSEQTAAKKPCPLLLLFASFLFCASIFLSYVDLFVTSSDCIIANRNNKPIARNTHFDFEFFRGFSLDSRAVFDESAI